MAAKRKTKHPSKPREDLSAPSKWRMQHGDIGPATRVADTETGTPIMQRRCTDTLGLMLAKGTGRRAVLLEIDPAYCDVIIQRWQDETGHAAVLDGEDRTFADVTAARVTNRS